MWVPLIWQIFEWLAAIVAGVVVVIVAVVSAVDSVYRISKGLFRLLNKLAVFLSHKEALEPSKLLGKEEAKDHYDEADKEDEDVLLQIIL